jgi:Ca2+-binding RTX toxin-like protein
VKKVKYEGADNFEYGFYLGVWLSVKFLGPYDISDLSGPIYHSRGTAELKTSESGKDPTITGIVISDKDSGLVATISGLSITPSAFDAGLGIGTANEGNVSVTYPFLVSLLDGKLSVIGSKFDDRYMEVGAVGKARVKSGDGNDSLFVWHEKTVDFNGGKGVDTILFSHNGVGYPYPTEATQQLVIDLGKGKGQNPYGGKLKLDKVENVVGTPGADKITGDNKANIIGDGAYDIGADVIKARGGNDIVKVASAAVGVKSDGGKGEDELQFSIDQLTVNEATTVLDLDNPANNTGPLAGNSFKGFEIFTATQFGGYLHHLDFRGSKAGETVVGVNGFYGSLDVKGADRLDGRGGDDTLDGRGGPDTLIGGSGKDTFQFTFGLVAGNVDTIVDFTPGADRIALSSFAIESIGAPGKLAASKFNALSAQDSNDVILYDKATGGLYHDPDGLGGTAPVLFATLANKADLKASDIIVIDVFAV